MGEPDPRQSVSAQASTQSLTTMRFDRVALLVGRSFYWTTSPTSPLEYLASMAELIRWCLTLPGARLGIPISDAATLVRDVYAVSSEQPPDEVQQLLDSIIGGRAANQWPADSTIWGRHIDKLVGWMKQAARGSEYVWLEPEEADWWITATTESLVSYNILFANRVGSSTIYGLISRHDCTVFAPVDGGATYDHLVELINALPPQRRLLHRQVLSTPALDRARLEEIKGAYWSWRLLNFATVGTIICTPLLALWSEWPSSVAWAPTSLAGIAERRQYTSNEVTALLQDAFWVRLETLFNTARNACGLGVAEPEFGDVESRPPLFFFVAPVDAPAFPEAYVVSLRPAIAPLVKTCLLSPDPLAGEVAWGVLEGDIVTLRREMSTRAFNQPRYLLLPTSARATEAPALEAEIGALADRLTYLEFSIGHEAHDVYTDIEPLAVRSAMWGGTLDLVNEVTGEAIDLLPAAHRAHLKQINDRLSALHLVLRWLQTLIETAASDTTQVESKYNGYLDGTDDYLHRTVTCSPVPNAPVVNLLNAFQSAYPYQYVKVPLSTLQRTMSQLTNGVEGINTSLNAIVELADRRTRDLSSRLGGIFNFIIALLALLVGLAQVIGAQGSTPTSASSSPSTSPISELLQLPGLNAAARLLFELVGLLLIATAVYYGVVWVTQRLPRTRHRFIRGIQRFRALVATAQNYAARARAGEPSQQADEWRQLDALDDEAVQTLASLWKDLRRAQEPVGRRSIGAMEQARRIRARGVREWEERARATEYSIELLDLAPRNVSVPRTLCVLRFKSTDLRSRTMVSDWDFAASLRAIGYSNQQANALDAWLSLPENRQRIQEWDVAKFASVLKGHGVTADPEKRAPDRWRGIIEE
jgi:hypothetical protein